MQQLRQESRATIYVATDEQVLQNGLVLEQLGILEGPGDTEPCNVVRRQFPEARAVELQRAVVEIAHRLARGEPAASAPAGRPTPGAGGGRWAARRMVSGAPAGRAWPRYPPTVGLGIPTGRTRETLVREASTGRASES